MVIRLKVPIEMHYTVIPMGTSKVNSSLLGGPKKTLRTLRNDNGAYTLWGDISFGRFVDQYVLLLNYKFQ